MVPILTRESVVTRISMYMRYAEIMFTCHTDNFVHLHSSYSVDGVRFFMGCLVRFHLGVFVFLPHCAERVVDNAVCRTE